MSVKENVKYLLNNGYSKEKIGVEVGLTSAAVYTWFIGRSEPSKLIQEKLEEMVQDLKKQK